MNEQYLPVKILGVKILHSPSPAGVWDVVNDKIATFQENADFESLREAIDFIGAFGPGLFIWSDAKNFEFSVWS